jgi:benzil reductase ((S)-benzoin forming)
MNLYVVTGTTRGLGAALAERIARDPDNELVAIARAPSGAIPGGVRIEADLADAAALGRACDALEERIRGKGYAKAVLVNNAGIVDPVGPLGSLDDGELAAHLAVNLVAPVFLMNRFLRMTEAVPVRRIINISSGAGRRPVASWSAYCTGKAGLDMASRVLALEAQQRGAAIQVTSLAPGVLDTHMQEVVRAIPDARFPDVARFRQLKDEGSLRDPGEIAARILEIEAAGGLTEPVMDLRELAKA